MTGAKIRAAFLAACEEEWDKCVQAGPNDDVISEYFRAIDWQWKLDMYGVDGQYSEVVRSRTGFMNYCGIGPASIGLTQLGNHIEPGLCLPIRLNRKLCYFILPSTYRANSPKMWQRANLEPPDQVPPADVAGGDLITVVTGSNKAYGDHFAVASGPVKDGKIPTIEWNATGTLGNGERGRGVVRRERPIADVRRVYRLDERHVEEGF